MSRARSVSAGIWARASCSMIMIASDDKRPRCQPPRTSSTASRSAYGGSANSTSYGPSQDCGCRKNVCVRDSHHRLVQHAARHQILPHDLHRLRIRFDEGHDRCAATQRLNAHCPRARVQVQKATAGDARPRMENRASRTLSDVGRSVVPVARSRRRPRWEPAITRITCSLVAD